MGVEFLPDWIYTFLLLPIILLFQKHFTLKNKVTKIETNQENYIKKIDDLCQSNQSLEEKVNQMLGRWDEHIREK